MTAAQRLSTIVLAAALGCAQGVSVRSYGAAEGLDNLAVLSLAQDKLGFLWAGTEGGLYRYDGSKFRRFGSAEGVKCAGEVQTLFASSDGGLWANTCSQLLRFDGRVFRPVPGITKMFGHGQAVTELAAGNVIVATEEGLQEVAYDPKTGSLSAQPYAPAARWRGHRVRAVFRAGSQLWFGCEMQLCVEQDGVVSAFGRNEGLPEDRWDAVGVTPDGAAWVRSRTKLYCKAAGSSRFQREGEGLPASMYWGALLVDSDGSFAIPTDKGVALFRSGQWRLIDYGQRFPMITAILRDRQGSYWAGSAGGGVVRCLGCPEWESWTTQNGLNSNLVWKILRDRKGAVWVGTGSGITRLYGASARSWGKKEGLPGENVRWIGETADGGIWTIAIPGGLARIDPATGVVRVVGTAAGLECKSPERGLLDRRGRLWVVGGSCLARNDFPTATNSRFVRVDGARDVEDSAWAIAEDRHGSIYVTGAKGLWKQLDSGTWQRYSLPEGLRTQSPYLMTFAADNSLYLRHRFDAGIDRIEFRNDRIVRSTEIVGTVAGSPDLTAFHGLDIEGNLWRGSSKGVFVLHNNTWRQFTSEEGLVWNDCDGEAFLAEPDGSVWLGTSGGLSHFRPRPSSLASQAADPILTSLEVAKTPRLLRASFSTLSFKEEQILRFEYRLDEGLWTPAPERTVTVAGIAAGKHRLDVRSAVRDAPFHPALASADFDIEPEWWESWWFRGLEAVLAASILAGIVWWRNRILKLRNASLENKVSERTAELEAERAKVVLEKQRADEASEAKGQFLADMSHEIRTPLNGLLGLTWILEDASDPEEFADTIRIMRSSGQTLMRIINDVLDLSKVEAGKLELETSPFDVPQTLRDVVALYRGAASAKGLTLSLVVHPDLPQCISGDETRLRQIVQNLISNALKFTTSGGVTVSVKEQRYEEPNHVIQIEVRDTGPGIPPDRLKQLFTPFAQADSSISRRFGGTGLGLAISKRFVELMGGTVTVESTVGLGSAFSFTIKARAASLSALPPHAHFDSGLPDLAVLLAEDNKVNQKVGLRLLKKLGVTADVVENGAQACEAVRRKRYDLILMDVQMPVMDGIEATKEIRATSDLGYQPCICGLSAHVTTEFKRRCLDAGMDHYLTKPIDLEKLASFLRESRWLTNSETIQ